MSVAVQTAFYAALKAAAIVHGVASTQVHNRVAPATATVPYIVYSEIPGRGPHYRAYDSSYLDEDIYQVACVAATDLAASTLRDQLTLDLDSAAISSVVQITKDRNVPFESPVPDQTRFVSGVYFRVKYLGG